MSGESRTEYFDVASAKAKIHDSQRYDVTSPRVSIVFTTGYYQGSTAETVRYDIDVLETIKHDLTSISSLVILPVIRRWETLVRLYYQVKEPESEGKKLYKIVSRHLNQVSPLTRKAAQERALPAAYRLRAHIAASGPQGVAGVVLDSRDLNSELERLRYIHLFMEEEEYHHATNEKDKYALIEREMTTSIRDRSRTSAGNAQAHITDQNPERAVLEYLKSNLIDNLVWEDLERDYLSWRLKMSSKNIQKYLNDTEFADYIKNFNNWFSLSRPRIPEPSDIPKAPFEYPDLSLLSDEFEFPPQGVFPLGKFIDVTYRDYLTIPASIKRVTLALSTSKLERRF